MSCLWSHQALSDKVFKSLYFSLRPTSISSDLNVRDARSETRFTARDRRRHTRQTTNTSRAHHAHVSHPTPKTKMEEARTLVATAYALRLTLCLSALCALRENLVFSNTTSSCHRL